MSAKTDTPRDTPALTDALRMVLLPLARMALARGLLARDVEEMMRVAFIAAAAETQPAPAPTRQISRLATATGLTRREVTRLLQVQRAAPLARRSPATEIFARWLPDSLLPGFIDQVIGTALLLLLIFAIADERNQPSGALTPVLVGLEAPALARYSTS